MKTLQAGRRAVLLARWIVSKCAIRNCFGSSGNESCTYAQKTASGAIRKTTKRDDPKLIVRQAPPAGPHRVDSLQSTIRFRRAVFQQDNASPHSAGVAQDFLRHFQTLPMPGRSRFVPCRALVE
ncbi:hypothetical protein TNCV_2425921 [Trichonephila clavipes]|nr:hypothetical protein TNCV_2425921 [Trichonephila clavipes]